MELRRYWSLVLKWWWLALACTLLAAASAFVATLYITPKYVASATLYIDTGAKQSTADLYGAELFLTQDVETTAQRLVLRPVMEGVIENLGLTLSPGALADMIAVKTSTRTKLITLDVTDTSPERAAAIANQISDVFNKRNRELLAERYQLSKTSISNQMALLERDMDQVQAQLDAQRAAAVADTAEVTRLESTLTQLRTTHAGLLQSYETIRMAESSALSNVVMDQPAVAPTSPSSPNRPRTIGLAAVVGLMLAAGVAFLIEYLDDTVKVPDDVEAGLQAPLMGAISKYDAETVGAGLIAVTEARSTAAEAFRVLRTNVQFACLDKPARALVVTSPHPMEGKSTIVANLAATMAQAGLSVVVVDADLRRPRQHRIFDLPNEAGLTTVLMNQGAGLEAALRPTAIPNLRVLTSGPLPPDPTVILNSPCMIEIERSLEALADVVLFDTPPLLMVADTAILANRASGVLLVVESGTTRRESAIKAVERLQQAGGRLLGIVLNKMPLRGRGYYYYHYYYYYYHHDDDSRGDGHSHGSRRRHRDPKPEARHP